MTPFKYYFNLFKFYDIIIIIIEPMSSSNDKKNVILKDSILSIYVRKIRVLSNG